MDEDDGLEERAITSVDRGILELKTAVHSMHLQIDSVQEKIDQYVYFGPLHRVTVNERVRFLGAQKRLLLR